MVVERYTDKSDKVWVRVKFMDQYRTEVVFPESEFEKQYGNIEQYVA